MIVIITYIVLALQAVAAVAAAVPPPDQVDPIVVKAEVIANVTDPRVSRDGCVSNKVNKNRVLWTCGDTLVFNAAKNKLEFPLVVNTASWSDLNADGSPKIIRNGPVGAGSNGSNPILLMYGRPTATDRKPFLPLTRPDACTINTAGNCEDGSRTVVWQNSAPMVQSSNPNGKTIAYTWTANFHLTKGVSATTKYPSYSLYRMTYDNKNPDREILPENKLVDGAFWGENEIGYGEYGRVVRDGWAYLYGTTQYQNTALAKVPVAAVEKKNKYQYFVNGAWTSQQPKISDPAAIIPNAGAGKPGTFYYSPYFSKFVWIGQRNMSMSANFYMSTAPAAEGPWKAPVLIYSGQNGDGKFHSYGLKAHPALLGEQTKEKKTYGIYLTWKQAWNVTSTYAAGYVTPLIYVTFK